MSNFAPYQVDYSVKNASKTFGFSKKRVVFKFGVANNEALAQGLTGAHCRGSEHEIIFIWSLNSGKRQIIADGKDVHFSESGMNGWTTDQVFQHHFNLRIPGFNSSVRCHLVTQPVNRDVPSIKPFDLRVNGASFFTFSKIYELGTPQMQSRPLKGSSRQGHTHMNPEDDPYCTPEERKAIAAAKLASIRDLQQSNGSYNGGSQSANTGGLNRNEGNLINLLDDPAPPPIPPPQQQSQFVSSMTMDTFQGSPGSAPPQSSYAQQPYGNYSLGGPPPPAQQQQQLNPYGQPPAAQAYGQPPQQQQQNYYAQPPAPSQVNTSFNNYQQPPAQEAFGQQQQQQQQPQYGFASPPSAGNNMMSPSAQSYNSYGSAPSFAQPPRTEPPQQYQQQQQYQGFPQY